MKTVLAGFGVIFLLLVFGLFALCNDNNDSNSFGPIRLVSHDYGGYECVSHEYCGGYDGGDRSDQNYDQWNNEDRNRNRNRNRGAFSPGPFDDSPVDAFNGNVICLPGSTCYGDRRGDEPPPEEGGQR